jgi:hypothetical protein
MAKEKIDLTAIRFQIVVHMANLDPKLHRRLEVYFK